MKTTISVRNMVCDRCIKVVYESLSNQGFEIDDVFLGKVVFSDDPGDLSKVDSILQNEGFELIDDQDEKLVSEIKIQILKWVRSPHEFEATLSEFLETSLHKSYSALSHIFSGLEGRTIEKYAILQRIEWVKELLVYGEKTISEIAWQTGYSSTQYLSNQFKTETGFSPTEFRSMVHDHRRSLDKI